MLDVDRKMVRLAIVATLVAGVTAPAQAQVFSDAARIGAYAGAMAYCRDNYMTSDDAGRYALLALRATDEYLSLNARDRAHALAFRNAALRGKYLDEALDADRCARLRRLLSIRYLVDGN